MVTRYLLLASFFLAGSTVDAATQSKDKLSKIETFKANVEKDRRAFKEAFYIKKTRDFDDSSNSKGKKIEDLQEYTWKEVRQHATEDDLWLVIHGGVYDLTCFVIDHPGGPEVLTDFAGGGWN